MIHDMSNKYYDINMYDYELPKKLIAQSPASPRDSSRLMVIDRSTGRIKHRIFRDLPEYLNPEDLIVFNDTEVIKARLYGTKKGGSSRAEILLLRSLNNDEKIWEALVRPGKKLKPGSAILLEDATCLEIGNRLPGGTRVVIFNDDSDVQNIISKYGRIPLPPYINNDNIKVSDYQTIFAEKKGSAAAPTASLHFTKQVLEDIREKGTETARVTLHVGIATFRPVKVDDIRNHDIHEEYCEVPAETAEKISRTEGRIIAAGTTVVRTLESMTDNRGITRPGCEMTNLFIYPGYRFKKVDAMLTNFHLPKSSLLMLVSAFAGWDNTMKAYKEAIKEEYRFFSFGDAMLII